MYSTKERCSVSFIVRIHSFAHGFFGLLVGVVAGAHHGAAGGVVKAHLVGFFFKLLEHFGGYVAQHRQVAVGGLQVLADGEHFDVVRAHVAQDFAHFVVGFAQADHNAGLGGHMGHHFFVAAQKFERVFVVSARACHFVQARVGFEIVVHYVGRGFGQDFQGDVEPAAEIGHENFDFGGGAGLADGGDAVGKVLGAAVAQVVAVDRSDDDVAQVHGAHGIGEILRLFGIERVGAAVADGAEGAAAGAHVAHNHKGGGAAAEAFADVGAGGFFADGVHFLLAQDVFNLEEFFWVGQLGADPLGLFQLLLGLDDFDRDAGGFAGAGVFDALAVVQGVGGFGGTHFGVSFVWV